MSLTINGYRRYRKVWGWMAKLFNKFEGWPKGYMKLSNYPSFKGYGVDGWVKIDKSKVVVVDTIGYGHYNHWRELLSLAVMACPASSYWNNPDIYKDKPFYYLINFVDNWGNLTEPALKKLRQDFTIEIKPLLLKLGLGFEMNNWFLEVYNQFKEMVLTCRLIVYS